MKRTLVIVGTFALGASFFLGMPHVRAENENDDEGERVTAQPQVTEQATVPKTKTVTQTIVVTPEKIVTENQIQTVILPDRDRDGIPDSEDPHPDIAEIYIVKDENQNGIVDTFEYGYNQ